MPPTRSRRPPPPAAAFARSRAEIAVSGSAGGRRVRGRLLAGVAAPASARLEAMAPFGPPLFIFVANNDDATLLLPRDDRVLEHGRPDAVLEAVAGVPLDAADLHATLTGCAPAGAPSQGRDARRPTGASCTCRRDRSATSYTCIATAARCRGGSWPRHGTSAANGTRGARSIAIFRTACRDRFTSTAVSNRNALRSAARACRRWKRTCRWATTSFGSRFRLRPTRSPLMSCAVRVSAFAKINLSLRVLGVRPDGYHELRTIFQSIALHDTLTVRARRGPFALQCDDPDCPTDGANLVWRAAERVWAASGRRGIAARRRDPTDQAHSAAGRPWRRQQRRGGGAPRCSVGSGASKTRVVARDRRRRSAPTCRTFSMAGRRSASIAATCLFPLIDQPAAWVTLVVPAFGVSTTDAYAWWDEAGGRTRARPAARSGRARRSAKRSAGSGCRASPGNRADRQRAAEGRRLPCGDVRQRVGRFRPVQPPPGRRARCARAFEKRPRDVRSGGQWPQECRGHADAQSRGVSTTCRDRGPSYKLTVCAA